MEQFRLFCATGAAGRRLLLAFALLILVSCGTSPPAQVAHTGQHPVYTPAEASLFGDTFSPDFFGAERPIPVELDQKLVRRVAAADVVIGARFSTVNRERRGDRQHFTLAITPHGPQLAGTGRPEIWTLEVPPESPSYAWLSSFGTSLVGKYLIVFLRRYNLSGSASVHWHIEPDTEPVRAAIGRARLITEVGT